MNDPRQIDISDFEYELPDDRIARYPVANRSDAKLLVWHAGTISDHTFSELPGQLPPNSLLLFNDSKVLNARLFFKTSSGATIEIFCLEPEGEMSQLMQAQGSVNWRCLVGRLKKWKEERLFIESGDVTLGARIREKKDDFLVIEFTWSPAELHFAEVLSKFGALPIPPYLQRETEDIDLSRYQTVYARNEGSVAAPTAGLHFTEPVLAELGSRGVPQVYLQLHVGTGTFKPVKADRMEGHRMHGEWLVVRSGALECIIEGLSGNIITVGTTSLRALESLYWLGRRMALKGSEAVNGYTVSQWEPYGTEDIVVPAHAALTALLCHMKMKGLSELWCRTSIIIAPPYTLKVAKGLITNFHQPRSTLLLLVAAVAGQDWKKIYDHALAHNYRFLSYGDSSLILGIHLENASL